MSVAGTVTVDALVRERHVLEVMACGVALPEVLVAISELVEQETGGRCTVDVGAGAADATTVASCSATVSLAGEPAGRVALDVDGPVDAAAAAVVARAATLTGMALRAARRAAELAHDATHDQLTGLPNRALLLDRIEHALAASRRRGGRVALLFLDLDEFKQVNDELGHRAGDVLLAEVGRRLAGCIRAGDTAARLGGDEFAILLDDTDEATPAQVVRRVQAALRPPVEVAGRSLTVKASIGVALADEDAAPVDLLERADTAMYADKRSARRHGHGGPRSSAPAGAGGVAAELSSALTAGQLRLHYQPVVELASGRVVGAEALLRWFRPGVGLVAPADFLPAARDLGLLAAMSAWVLEEAAQQLAAWRRLRRGAGTLRVGVNVSARQLVRDDFERVLVDATASAGVAPEDVVVEVSEAEVLIDGPAAAVENLGRLGALGAVVALDDFGAGRSSFRELRELPVHQVKVGRSLAARRGEPEGAFATALARLGVDVGLEAVAVGIERPTQLAALQAVGCATGQGYLFARPAPGAALEPLLAAPTALAAAAVRRSPSGEPGRTLGA